MSVEHDDEWGMPGVTVATFYNREEKGEEEDDVVGEDEFDDDKNIGSNVAYSKYIPQKKVTLLRRMMKVVVFDTTIPL